MKSAKLRLRIFFNHLKTFSFKFTLIVAVIRGTIIYRSDYNNHNFVLISIFEVLKISRQKSMNIQTDSLLQFACAHLQSRFRL